MSDTPTKIFAVSTLHLTKKATGKDIASEIRDAIEDTYIRASIIAMRGDVFITGQHLIKVLPWPRSYQFYASEDSLLSYEPHHWQTATSIQILVIYNTTRKKEPLCPLLPRIN